MITDSKIEDVKGLYNKLLYIQCVVAGLAKDKDGPGNKYKYVTGNKVLDNIKPLMCELGLILKQEVTELTNTRMDYFVGTPPRAKSEILSSCKMVFTWVDCETKEMDVNHFAANGQNDWDKGVGSALTYGERYFFLKYFHLETDKDDVDNPERPNNKPENEPVAPPPPPEPVTKKAITKKQVDQLLLDIAANHPTALAEAKKIYTFSDNATKVIKEAVDKSKTPPPAI